MKRAALTILIGGLFMVGAWAAGDGSYYKEKEIREAVAAMVTAMENHDIDTIRRSISPEFLEGNPEIIGRVNDSFEKYDKIRIIARISSIQVNDGIANIKLNWTKTFVDRMNNWAYRDIGNNVVLQFNALAPYQLIGLQEPNLFGVSFLLQTRLVITAPALAKLELDKKKLELEERKLMLQEKDKEDARIKQEQETREKAEAAAKKAAQAPDKKETETRSQAEKVVTSKADSHQTTAPEPPSTDDDYAQSLQPLSTPLPLPSPTPSAAELSADMERSVRIKADQEAMELLARRRPVDISPAYQNIPTAVPMISTPPTLSPESQQWRQEKLKQLRELDANTVPVMTEPLPPIPAPELPVTRPTAAVSRPTLAPTVSRSSPTPRAPPVSFPLAKPTPPTPAHDAVQRAENSARLSADVRSKADSEAMRILKDKLPTRPADVSPTPAEAESGGMPTSIARIQDEARARAKAMQFDSEKPASVATTLTPVPIDTPPVKAPTPDTRKLAAEVKARAEAEAQKLLAKKTLTARDQTVVVGGGRATDATAPTTTSESGSVSTPVASPGNSPGAMPGPLAANAPPKFADPAMAVLNSMKKITGAAQPDGPVHDFFINAYEVTTEEFARFLNDAKTNPEPVGRYMFFDEQGNVFMDNTLNPTKKLFSITPLDFGGQQKGIVFKDGRYTPAPGKEKHPVTGVSWYGAVKYCNWLSFKCGFTETNGCYSEGLEPDKWHPASVTDEEWVNGFSDTERQLWIEQCLGFRLPMNSYNTSVGKYNEFYRAAAWNGRENTTFGFGRDDISGQDANFLKSGDPFDDGPTPVGYYDGADHGGFQTRANENACGLYDMSGNVWEWSNDTTGNMNYRALYGGSWQGDKDSLKTSYRGSINPHNTSEGVGFRVVFMKTPDEARVSKPSKATRKIISSGTVVGKRADIKPTDEKPAGEKKIYQPAAAATAKPQSTEAKSTEAKPSP